MFIFVWGQRHHAVVLGAVGPYVCHQCSQPSDFYLIENLTKTHIFGINIGKPTATYELECGTCHSRHFVPQKDVEEMIRARDAELGSAPNELPGPR